MANLGNETVASYYFSRDRRVDVVGCWDSDTPPNEYDFYDLFLYGPNEDTQGECLNLGEPIADMPSRDEVKLWLEGWDELEERPVDPKQIVYQPEHDEDEWNEQGFHSFMVYANQEDAQADFPNLTIFPFYITDIEEPTILFHRRTVG